MVRATLLDVFWLSRGQCSVFHHRLFVDALYQDKEVPFCYLFAGFFLSGMDVGFYQMLSLFLRMIVFSKFVDMVTSLCMKRSVLN